MRISIVSPKSQGINIKTHINAEARRCAEHN
jgi:hypothetical protein